MYCLNIMDKNKTLTDFESGIEGINEWVFFENAISVHYPNNLPEVISFPYLNFYHLPGLASWELPSLSQML